MCRSKNVGVAGYAEDFSPVQSGKQASGWCSYLRNDVLEEKTQKAVIEKAVPINTRAYEYIDEVPVKQNEVILGGIDTANMLDLTHKSE